MISKTLTLAVAIIFVMLFLIPLKSESILSAKVVTSKIQTGEGFVAVYGEVLNDGDKPLKKVPITTIFYDSNNSIIGAERGLIALDTLMPNDRSPFVLTFATKGKQVSDYAVLISNVEVSPPKQAMISITSHALVFEQGLPTVIGKLRNDSSLTSSVTLVHAIFYDSIGKLVGIASAAAQPEELPAGKEAEFKISPVPELKVSGASDYYLISESKQYLSTPVESKAKTVGQQPAQIPSEAPPEKPKMEEKVIRAGEIVTVSEPILVNIMGSAVTDLRVGDQVIVSSTVSNNQVKEQKLAYIVQIKDSNDLTVMLSWAAGSLPPEKVFDLGLSWIPEAAGKYSIEVFVWQSVTEPVPLTGIKSLAISVEEP